MNRIKFCWIKYYIVDRLFSLLLMKKQRSLIRKKIHSSHQLALLAKNGERAQAQTHARSYFFRIRVYAWRTTHLDRIHTFLVLAKLHLVSSPTIHWVDSEFSWKSQQHVLLPCVWQLRDHPLLVAIFVQRPQGHLKGQNVKFDLCQVKSIKAFSICPDKGNKIDSMGS